MSKVLKEDLSNTLLITHKNCPDGCGCAVIFLSAGGLKHNIHYVVAGDGVDDFITRSPADYLNQYDKIYIVDVSPTKKMVGRIEKEYPQIFCIDHHKTALHLQNKPWTIIDMEKCGCFLFFEHLYPEIDQDVVKVQLLGKDQVLLNFVTLINDRDLWQNKYRKSNELSMLMEFLGQKKFVDRAMKDFFFFDWDRHEEELLEHLFEKKEKYIESKLEDVKIIEIDTCKVGLVFVSQHESDVLNRVLVTMPDVKCAIGVKMDTGTVSLRSRDPQEFDVAEFAKKFGGGGHARAAGHSIDKQTILEIINTLYP